MATGADWREAAEAETEVLRVLLLADFAGRKQAAEQFDRLLVRDVNCSGLISLDLSVRPEATPLPPGHRSRSWKPRGRT